MILLPSLDEARYERSAGQMSRLISRVKNLKSELDTLVDIFGSASCFIPAHFHIRLKSMLDSYTIFVHAVLMRRQLTRMGLDELTDWEVPHQIKLEKQLTEFEDMITCFKARLFKKSNKQFL